MINKIEKTCWKPEISPTQANDTNDIIASKYFGNPWLAQNETWPEINNEAALFVLQLDIATLPKEVAKNLGNKGLLQFFFSREGGWGDEDYYRLRIIHPDANSANGSTQAQPDMDSFDFPEDRTQKIISSWTEYKEMPHGEEFEYDMDMDSDDDDESEDYPYMGDKLGGWAYWTQANDTPNDSRGNPMIMVYQLDAGCFFGNEKNFPAHAPTLFAGDGTGHMVNESS